MAYLFEHTKFGFCWFGPSCIAYIAGSNRCIRCQKSRLEKAAERSGRSAG